MIFLLEAARGQSRLTLKAPQVQTHGCLNGILKENDESEPGTSRGLNAQLPQ